MTVDFVLAVEPSKVFSPPCTDPYGVIPPPIHLHDLAVGAHSSFTTGRVSSSHPDAMIDVLSAAFMQVPVCSKLKKLASWPMTLNDLPHPSCRHNVCRLIKPGFRYT